MRAFSYQSCDCYDRARNAYEDIAGNPGDDPAADWAAFWLGVMLKEKGESERLREVFSKRSPPWGRFWLAAWNFSNGRYDSASTMFSALATGERGQTILKLMAGYFQGLSLSYLGETDSAKITFTKLLEKYKRSLLEGEIYYRIASIDFAHGEWQECREHLAAALDFYEISSRKEAHWWSDEALFLTGATDFMEGRHLLAMRRFERLRHRFPDSPYVERLPYLSILGEIETKSTDAAQDSALIAALSPDLKADVMLRIGYLFMQDGELSVAQGHFLKAAEIAHDRAMIGESYLFAAECAYRKRRFDEAAGYYQLAYSHAEDRKRETGWGLGWCYLKTRQYDDSRLYFATVFSGCDDVLADRARVTYAEVFLAEGKPRRAATELVDFLKTCTGVACDNALFDLIVAYRAMADTGGVIETSRRFIKSHRRSVFAEKVVPGLTDILFEKGEFGEVIGIADEADIYALSRETADRVRFSGERARYYLGIYDDPLLITDRFLEKYPDSPLVGEILIEVGSYLCNIGDYEKGAIAFDRLRRRRIPDSLWIEASYRMGQCYLGMGDTIAAQEIFGQLMGEFYWSPVAARGVISLGDYFKKNGRFESAISEYNKVLENAADSIQLAIADLRIAESYEGMGRYPEARILYKNLIGRETATEYVRHTAILGLTRVYYKMAEFERGYEVIRTYYDTLEADSFRCVLGEQMGKLALRLGMVELALETLLPSESESLFCDGSEDQAVLYDLSLALEFRNRINDARRVWGWMVNVSEDDSIVALARNKLNEYGGAIPDKP